jgi:putative DNA primase/helicase
MDRILPETVDRLHAHHKRMLLEESGIDPEVVAERGYRTIDRPSDGNRSDVHAELKRGGISSRFYKEDRLLPGLVIPRYSPTGERYDFIFKPYTAVPDPKKPGKHMKYATPSGSSTRLDVHPRNVNAMADPTIPIWFTEGIKKADALTSHGKTAVAMNGVFGYRTQYRTSSDFEDIAIKGRTCVIIFDSDVFVKPEVQRAMGRFGKWLKKSKGAGKVIYCTNPPEFNGVETKGLDDYLAAGGTIADFKELATQKPPMVDEDGSFSDAKFIESVVEDCLLDEFIHVDGLEWLQWDGTRWAECGDKAVREAIRAHNTDTYNDLLDKAKSDVKALDLVMAFKPLLSANRINNLVTLAKGMEGISVDINTLDTHHDLLNCKNGVLDLQTGELLAHDPALFFTKVTKASWKPGQPMDLVGTMLEAVPADSHSWLQAHLGQAITGHHKSGARSRMVMLTGSGFNGKSVLMDNVHTALGDFSVKVPSSLLLTKGKNSGGATPEKMVLRGTRMAYMEETPEARYLDGQTLKEVVDTPTMDGRYLYKGTVNWVATHSIFLNTNHPPRVAETDDAVWTRTTSLKFPFRFVKDEASKEYANDRVGNPRIMVDLKEDSHQSALLEWLVAGAMGWYANGRIIQVDDTETVLETTKAWRAEADPLFKFYEETLKHDVDSWVSTVDLYNEYKKWMKIQGAENPPNLVTFISRLMSHGQFRNGLDKVRMTTSKPGRSLPSERYTAPAGGVQVVGGVSFAPLSDDAVRDAVLGKQAPAITGLRFRSLLEDDDD